MYERKESIASIWRVNLNCWTLKMEALPAVQTAAVPNQVHSPSCSPLQYEVLQTETGVAWQQNAAVTVIASEQVNAVWLFAVRSI
jgi:hypothetical protein